AFSSQARGEQQGAAQKGAVFFLRVGQGDQVPARADEDEGGRLRRDILECEKLRIFIHEPCRQFAFADLAKDAVVHGPPASGNSLSALIALRLISPQKYY